jgi:superfamily II helicase
VVVSAPTGAGKTAIAEAAAIAVLARGQRVIYTTPLKVNMCRCPRASWHRDAAEREGL